MWKLEFAQEPQTFVSLENKARPRHVEADFGLHTADIIV